MYVPLTAEKEVELRMLSVVGGHQGDFFRGGGIGKR